MVENESEFSGSVARATLDGAASAAARRTVASPFPAEEARDVFRSDPVVNQDDWSISKKYSFGYSSSQGSRREESSDDGVVRGSYTMVGADGLPVVVRYRAGPEIGYVVENLDEVIAASTPIHDGAAPATAAVVGTGGVAVEAVDLRTSSLGGTGGVASSVLPFGSRTRTLTSSSSGGSSSGLVGGRVGVGSVGAGRSGTVSVNTVSGGLPFGTRSKYTVHST